MRPEMIKIDKTTIIEKEGMVIRAFIAGVNSGVYDMPFVIKISCWARKWFFKKFFHCEMQLQIKELELLKGEIDKSIELYYKKIGKQNAQ
jgi:hypothetical protein